MNGRTGRLVRRFSLASLAATTMLIAVPSGASAATATIGQLSPSPPVSNCGNPQPFDQVQASVTSGTSYAAPADGTITSWSHNAIAGTEHEIKFKVFRHLAGPNEFQVVTHDERTLNEGALNTFNASIPVQAGDVIGFNDGEDPLGCRFSAPGEDGIRIRQGDLADGASAANFGTGTPGLRLNISAVLTTPNPLTATCKGKPATIFGTAQSDDLTGTDDADVIAALGGADPVRGLDGEDRICGGKGKDKLRGGGAKDKLFGQKGRDKLKGGGGRDVCKGGGGNDSASKCETERSL
jgi:Ca2+-binding RTX toxin-like protein